MAKKKPTKPNTTNTAPAKAAQNKAPQKFSQEELDELLFDALGEPSRMKKLLAEGADPKAADRDGLPALIAATELDKNAYESCKLLLEAGADVSATYEGIGWTALHAAVCGDEDVALVSLLLAHGANPNQKSTSPDTTETPLTLLLSEDRQSSRTKTVKALLEAKADPNLPRGDGWTPLMLIASGSDLEGATLLLTAGANLLATKGEGQDKTDAIKIAAYWNQNKMVELLTKAGAKDPLEDCKTRISSHWKTISAWCEKHAKAQATELKKASPATNEDIARLEKIIGNSLPMELKAELLLHGGKGAGGNSGSFYFEYSGLDIDQIIGCWEGLENLRAKGKLEHTPKETTPDNYRIRCVWWHPGWIPFAEDGGGNLICVDVEPPGGYRGQVLQWEIHAGPVGPIADDFEAYMKDYAKKLTSGKYKYDPDSGTFDS